ncbi:hypothetical protein SCOCK_400080 [Actinacidiphila cocklensis]|uniref:Uncharacterized protein n=1 Tax=Actinacidiphila cocklensis TaxID=887465 RepID=A0A9W4DUI1_9ACTN|nr:hypothetical protein SCOCK_400080 [Actinacidiphila cocklensis]
MLTAVTTRRPAPTCRSDRVARHRATCLHLRQAGAERTLYGIPGAGGAVDSTCLDGTAIPVDRIFEKFRTTKGLRSHAQGLHPPDRDPRDCRQRPRRHLGRHSRPGARHRLHGRLHAADGLRRGGSGHLGDRPERGAAGRPRRYLSAFANDRGPRSLTARGPRGCQGGLRWNSGRRHCPGSARPRSWICRCGSPARRGCWR